MINIDQLPQIFLFLPEDNLAILIDSPNLLHLPPVFITAFTMLTKNNVDY